MFSCVIVPTTTSCNTLFRPEFLISAYNDDRLRELRDSSRVRERWPFRPSLNDVNRWAIARRIRAKTKQVGHLRDGGDLRVRAGRRTVGRRERNGEERRGEERRGEERTQEAGVFRDVACAVYANWARVNARLSGCPGRDLTSPRTGSSFYLLLLLHLLYRPLPLTSFCLDFFLILPSPCILSSIASLLVTLPRALFAPLLLLRRRILLRLFPTPPPPALLLLLLPVATWLARRPSSRRYRRCYLSRFFLSFFLSSSCLICSLSLFLFARFVNVKLRGLVARGIRN